MGEECDLMASQYILQKVNVELASYMEPLIHKYDLRPSQYYLDAKAMGAIDIVL